MEMLPLCLMFFTFFLSLGGSLRALMMRAAAEGTTLTLACLFWMGNLTSHCPQADNLDLIGIELGWHVG